LSITHKKIGIIGGGQLGKMLIQAASNWDLEINVLDPSEQAPCKDLCTCFFQGKLTDEETVYAFGKRADIITIEIEAVNVNALKRLKKEGKIVIPEPDVLEIIQDKGLQKEFYVKNNLPTSIFKLYSDKNEILKALELKEITLPFVQKSRKDGYDGKGVAVIKSENDLNKLMDTASVIEEMVKIKKEIAVIVAKNENDEIKAFPSCEMDFHPEANLVEFLFAPSQISAEMEQKAQQLAIDTIKAFNTNGILAVEMFLTDTNQLLINEVAPRPHNSGHHTIEANITSQYEQHLRTLLNLPLGSTEMLSPAVMVNLLGEDGYSGKAIYQGFEEVSKLSGVKVHLYGKAETKPYRKMGHITVIDKDLETAKTNAKRVKDLLKVVS
jgi:5-(carboxyamino)imidazole ribonucleotide synthase